MIIIGLKFYIVVDMLLCINGNFLLSFEIFAQCINFPPVYSKI